MRIKKIAEKILKHCLKYKSFQDFVNNNYNRHGYYPVNLSFDFYCEHDGKKFHVDENFDALEDAVYDYDFSKLTKDMTLLDIGGNFGGVAILNSSKANHVYVVEPLYTDLLNENIKLNDINNITVIKAGLGTGTIDISYKTRKESVQCFSLTELIDMCGGRVDYLKMDCEGGEWSILCHELQNIKYIEAEIHCFEGMPKLHVFKNMLTRAGFKYTVEEQIPGITEIIHARKHDPEEMVNQWG